jgi:hypothetical protein
VEREIECHRGHSFVPEEQWHGKALPANSHDRCPITDINVQIYSTEKKKSYAITCDVDYYDSDLKGKPVYVKNMEECVAACEKKNKCVEVILSGAACYLKTSVKNPAVSRPKSSFTGARCVEGC